MFVRCEFFLSPSENRSAHKAPVSNQQKNVNFAQLTPDYGFFAIRIKSNYFAKKHDTKMPQLENMGCT